LFVIFAVVCCLSISALAATPIEEDRQERSSSVADCLKLLGSPFILRSVSSKVFFGISVAMMAVAMLLLFVGQSLWLLYVGVALIGFGNSNIFSIVFAQALFNEQRQP
jgi:hypothetical protein